MKRSRWVDRVTGLHIDSGAEYSAAAVGNVQLIYDQLSISGRIRTELWVTRREDSAMIRSACLMVSWLVGV